MAATGVLGAAVLAGIGPGATVVPPWRSLPLVEQAVLFNAVYPVKALYMLLAAGVVVLIWNQPSTCLRTLREAVLVFLAAEMVCWINLTVLPEENRWLEYLHSWGMVICLSGMAYAALEAFDHSVLHYSDPAARCALAGQCRHCAKHAPVSCALERLFRRLLPLLMAAALLPWAAPIAPVAYQTTVLGLPRILSHPLALQVYELRYAPLAGLLLLGAAGFPWFPAGRRLAAWPSTKLWLSAGLGHLGFAFLRLLLLAVYHDHLGWFFAWEEFTELWLILGIGLVLTGLRPDLIPILRSPDRQ